MPEGALPYTTSPPVPIPTPESPYIPGFFPQELGLTVTPYPTPHPTPHPTQEISPRPSPSPSPEQQEQEELAQFILPTQKPTAKPTQNPTPAPTAKPTQNPTPVPTAKPTVKPTQNHTPFPTAKPTVKPTQNPTPFPTAKPTQRPTPVLTAETTGRPTGRPTLASTAKPTQRPTPAPTVKPTANLTDKPTAPPTPTPTAKPTGRPTPVPTAKPTGRPTQQPTPAPTDKPTRSPTSPPTPEPTLAIARQTLQPTPSPTNRPTTKAPTPVPGAVILSAMVTARDGISYQPGKLTQLQAGLKLSAGLNARVIARSGQPVEYRNRGTSNIVFHGRPDAGHAFPDNRPNNEGGWIYVSNSEMRLTDLGGGPNMGGVGAITFDKRGRAIKYETILANTTWNCGGGRTPWGSWVSCEEQPGGNIYQVDPYGLRKGENMTLGSEGGTWESFTYDLRNMSEPHFYITEDSPRGAIQRFTPNKVDWKKDPWKMLHGSGRIEYLKLIPNEQRTGGRYRWITRKVAARNNAFQFYPSCEGIDSDGESIFFVSKQMQMLYELDLATGTYTNSSTVRGKFNGKPDQVARILANGNNVKNKDDLLYFTEEQKNNAGER